MIEVIIADDHAVVRTGLKLFFQGHQKIQISAEAQNGNTLLEMLSSKNFSVAVIDLNMPGKDSLDLINCISAMFPKLPIVILTMNTDKQLTLRLLKLGVYAFINKEESPEIIEQAILSAANYEKFLTYDQKSLFANQLISGEAIDAPHLILTDREYQIMCLMATGKSNSEISVKLTISKNTLSNHRNNILKKLRLCNNAELTKYAIDKHLIH